MNPTPRRLMVAVGLLAAADLALPRRGLGIPLLLYSGLVVLNFRASVRTHRPSRVLPWAMISFTTVCGAVAVAIHTLSGRRGLGMPPVSNVLLVVALVAWCLGSAMFVRARSSALDRYLVLDLSVLLLAAVIALKRLVLDPLFATHPPTGLSPSLSMTMILLELVAVVFLVRFATLRGPRPAAMWLLVSSVGVSLIGSMVANATPGDIGMHVSTFLSGLPALLAVAHPSMGRLTEPSEGDTPSFGAVRITALGVALLMSPVAAVVVYHRTGELSLAWLLGPSVVLTALVLLRLRLVFGREKAAQNELESSRGAFRALIHGITDAIMVLDHEGRIVYASESAGVALATGERDLVGELLGDLVVAGDREMVQATAAIAWGSGATATVEVHIAVDATVRSFDASFADRTADLNVKGVILVLHDVTERNVLETRLRHQALHDGLTGLPNRTLLSERLTDTIAADGGIGMLFVDLDDFKAINDGLGHDVGDKLLQAVSVRLSDVVRADDTVARLGGDEFAILVKGDRAEEIAHRLLVALATPFAIDGHRISIGASVGIAAASGTTPDELLRNADVAMYRAKADGKGTYAVFEPGMEDESNERLQLQMELADALAERQFRLLYQPIFELATGRLTGVEALLRWDHPVHGTLAPDRFIPTAEETGLIVGIGKWVLDEACAQAASWPDDVDIAVNLSARQLESDAIVDHVAGALAMTGLRPDRLVLEITETMLSRDLDATAAYLNRLTDLGVRIAIDDFGTGYSSLSSLSRFPVHVLKIDRSFIAVMLSSPESSALVHVLVEMGRAMHLQVVAEGIEDAEQAAALRGELCDQGQGFYFSRPVNAIAIGALLIERYDVGAPA